MNEYKAVHLDKQTTDGAEMNIEALYQLFPSCFTEAKDVVTGEMRRVVDWNKLRSLLGDYVDEGEPERYDFTWGWQTGCTTRGSYTMSQNSSSF